MCVYSAEMGGRKFRLGKGRKNEERKRQLRGKNKPGRASKAKKVSVLDRGKTSEMHCIVI